MTYKQYLPRLADKELALRLEAFGATLIVGPKWCGKTTTAEMQAKSVLKMQDPDRRESYLTTANTKPSLLLLGDKPRLIDEWQVAPELWDAVRSAVDEENREGLFILTGSNSVDENSIMHTGIGRISRMKMYPMTLFESGESNGKISLLRLFDDPNYDIDGIRSDLSVEELIFAACRGGWPSSLSKRSDAAKLIVASDYLDGICAMEISTVDGKNRDPEKARHILRSYARNVSTLATEQLLRSDIAAVFNSISASTFDDYHSALEKLFVIEDVPAWCPSIRSASAIRSRYKREFVDPSIGIAALGVDPEYFYTDLKTFGFFFETLCARDLRVYSQSMRGQLSYYHDRYDLEADFVLHLKDGRYALIECKLGSREISNGIDHLLSLNALIEKYNSENEQCPLSKPSALIVLTGGEMAYKSKEGVYIIPIGCLKD